MTAFLDSNHYERLRVSAPRSLLALMTCCYYVYILTFICLNIKGATYGTVGTRPNLSNDLVLFVDGEFLRAVINRHCIIIV